MRKWAWREGEDREVETEKWSCIGKNGSFAVDGKWQREETDLSLTLQRQHTHTTFSASLCFYRQFIIWIHYFKTYFLAMIATTIPNIWQGAGTYKNKPFFHQRWVSGEEMSHWNIIWHPLQCWIQSHYNWKSRRKFVRKRTHNTGTHTHCVNLLL